MYMRVFEYGKGDGAGPVEYVTHSNTPKRERSPPQVLRGNPTLTKELINSLSTDWKYTSGVLSWNHIDKVSVEQENEIMDAFENLAFAGLQADQYNVLWTRHIHADHHELHFVVPRVEVYGGKSFNPCPPNWQAHYDPMRDYYNVKHNWHRPDNPAKRKLPSPQKLDEMKGRLRERRKKLNNKNVDKFKEDLIEFLIFNLRHDFVHSREDVINIIHELGFALNRKGKDYITPLEQESGIKFRLKNGIFAEGWNLENTNMQELIHDTFYAGLPKEEVLTKLQAQIDEITQRRRDYNHKRYTQSQDVSDTMTMEDAVTFDIHSSHDALSEQTSYEVINDGNSKLYQADTTKYRTSEPSTQRTSSADLDETNTIHSQFTPKSDELGERTRGIIELLKGFYNSIQRVIRVLPELVRNNRRGDVENDDNLEL